MSVNVDVGPIDYLALEFPGARLNGEGMSILVDLVDRGGDRRQPSAASRLEGVPMQRALVAAFLAALSSGAFSSWASPSPS